MIISEKEQTYLKNKISDFFESGFLEAYEEDKIYRWFYDTDFVDDVNINIDGCTKYVFEFDFVPNVVVKCNRKSCIKDYCSIEAENYKKAINEELEKYFASTFFLTEQCGVSFYIQEWVEPDGDSIEDEMYNYASKLCSKQREEMDEDEFADCIWEFLDNFDAEESLNAVFGEDYETDRLVVFCEQNRINDLHRGNFGYRRDFPVIIDFSGIQRGEIRW